jgi:hypothetical protein
MGFMSALNGLAVLLFGLPIGAWIDRVRRRPRGAAFLIAGQSLGDFAMVVFMTMSSAFARR